MRIISLLPGATDALIALGGVNLVVGVSHACDAPAAIPRVTSPAIDPAASSGAIDAAVRTVAFAGQPLFSLDAARIVALHPDLIVTQALCDVCAVNEADVRALAGAMAPSPRVLSVSGTSLEGVFTDILAIGSAAELGADADELVLVLRRRMRSVHETLKAAQAPRPRVAMIEWTDPLYAGGHWVPEQVKRAGGIDVLAVAGAHSLTVTPDRVRDAKPDIVIVAPCGFSLARAAAVSKGTLYVYFADKSALFEAILEEEALFHGQVVFNFDPARDAETTLKDFGQAYLHLLCRPGGGSAIRTVMAIAERMPELGSRFYTHVIAHTVDRFAAYLEARAALGELVMDDTQLAAWQFMQMCQATLFQAFIFQANPSPSPERIATVVDSATRVFFAAYRPKQAN